MHVDDHLTKIKRLERQRAKIDRIEDCEMWYWATLNAGVHAMNAALHAVGATKDDPWSAHNVPIYHVASRKPGGWEPALKPLGDIEHVDSPEMEAIIPASLKKAGVALRKMEHLREPILRGDAKVSNAMLDRMDALYQECLTVTRQAIAKNRRAGR